MEFYQKGQFITMTGDGAGFQRLESFDSPDMKALLESKFARREEWTGTGKGIDGLSSLSDREVLERGFAAKNGDSFKRLYNGEDVYRNHSNSDMALMNHLAFWCGHDIDQMLRINATSGLFRPSKPQSYYEHMAIKAVKTTPTYTPPKASTNASKASGGGHRKV